MDDDEDFNSAVLEGLLNFPFDFHEMNSKVFIPFEINESIDTPLTEMDPDIQYYSNSNYTQGAKCDYYLEDQFISKVVEQKNCNRLSFFHLNVKSIPKHFDELEMYINSLKLEFTMIALTETWLDQSKQDLYNMPKYNCINRFRKQRRGGGVSLYIKNDIKFMNRPDLEYFDVEMESLFIEIDKNVFNLSSNVVVGVIYRMPNTCMEIFNDRMSDIMNIVQRERKICYFLGDLNVDLLKHESHQSTAAFLDSLYSYNVFPLITKPTRVTRESATLIDHVLTNNFDINSKHVQGILCTSISDHYAIFHIAGNAGITSADDIPVLKRNFTQNNMTRFTNEMENVDWEFIKNIDDTQTAYSVFHNLLVEKFNSCFPLKCIKKAYYTKKPWLTAALRESIKVKNKLYVNRHKGNNPDERCAQYKIYRNKLHYLLRAAERRHYQNLLYEHKSNVKKSWQILKMVINKKKTSPVCTKFKCNDGIINDKNEISDKFNKFFVNVGVSLAAAIAPSNKNPLEYMKNDTSITFQNTPVTEREMENILMHLKDSSSGWDELRPNVMKTIKESIIFPLMYITNLSFQTGVFPMELKIANVVPIFKAGDEMFFTNYRPVSVLPVFSKILERLMYNRLIEYINENKLLYKYQFGFQKGKSTYMAVLTLVDKISEALNNGDYVIGVFLDFSKAFDTVDHDILLKKLEKYGIQGAALDWFTNYLSNRLQYVTYNGAKSKREIIKCGVPQGSILGPLLFLLYINDLSTVSNDCFSVLFADDTNMFVTGKNTADMCVKLNNDLQEICEWLRCNKLSLNILKTHYMIFTSKNKTAEDLDIKISNTAVERVYDTKFLGVYRCPVNMEKTYWIYVQ